MFMMTSVATACVLGRRNGSLSNDGVDVCVEAENI